MKKVDPAEQPKSRHVDRRALSQIEDLIDDGVYEAASVLAWELQADAPGNPRVWLLLARIDYLRERYAAAMYAARMATRLDPTSAIAWLALATTAAMRPRWRTEGLDAALQATALAPADSRSWTALAQLHLLGGDPYKAAVAAERAVGVNPQDRGAHLMLGEIALDAGEPSHAESAFRHLLALDPTDRDGLLGLGEALESQGINPGPELARYAGPQARPAGSETGKPGGAPRKRRRASDGTVADHGPRTTARPAWLGGVTGSPRRITAIVVVVSLGIGLLVGTALPSVGVVRGVVAALAVSLMWIGVAPLRARRVAAQRTMTEGTGTLAGDARLADELASRDAARAGSADIAPVSAPVPDAEPAPSTAPGPDGPTSDEPAVVPAGDVQEPVAALPPRPGHPRASAADDATAEIVMPNDPDELAQLSRTSLAASNVELAHAAASRLEAVAPGSLDAHRALAAVALAERDYAQAQLHYRKVLELEPLDQDAHERLSLVSAGTPGGTRRRFGLRGPWGRQ